MRRNTCILILLCAFALALFGVCSNPTDPEETTGTGDDDITDGDHADTHDDPADYEWNESDVVEITLIGNNITAESGSVTIDGSTATITSSGTYRISGSLNDGQIIVNTDDEEIVRLILNNAHIACSDNAPLFIASAEKTLIVLADDTENYLEDGVSYVYDDPDEDEPNAALFSKDDLTIFGGGGLTVNGRYNDGITSKDGLIITSGAITINADDDGIRGKDYLVIANGALTINADGDGLKSDNDDDPTMGYIAIDNVSATINADGDAITAETDVVITDGVFSLISGGGSTIPPDDGTSTKGIKAGANVRIDGGVYTINSSDDAVHSNGELLIDNGTFQIASGDDAIHADSNLVINNGVINITKSYEGIESSYADVTINDGEFHIVSSDDGINAAGGGESPPPHNGMSAGSTSHLYINGGYIAIVAVGDGIDINGSITMTAGTVIVHGPTMNNNSAIDYDVSFKLTGGLLVAAGSAGMDQGPGSSSTQYSVLMRFRSVLPAGHMVHIETAGGEEILTFVPSKVYNSIAFSSPLLQAGTTYYVYINGSSTGTVTDGLYQGGTYSPGSEYSSFSLSSISTIINL